MAIASETPQCFTNRLWAVDATWRCEKYVAMACRAYSLQLFYENMENV